MKKRCYVLTAAALVCAVLVSCGICAHAAMRQRQLSAVTESVPVPAEAIAFMQQEFDPEFGPVAARAAGRQAPVALGTPYALQSAASSAPTYYFPVVQGDATIYTYRVFSHGGNWILVAC